MTRAILNFVLCLALFVLAASVFCSCENPDNKSSITGGTAQILLFNGTGGSPKDVSAIESILKDNCLSYVLANSSQLNALSEAQLGRFRVLIIPGGNFIDMGNSLTPRALANIHNAVHGGLNYLGICAGGFLAGNSTHYNSLKLTGGVAFGFYSAENKGIRKAAIAITSPDTPTLEQYWEDGPQFTGWGNIAAKYPDGTPAIVQGTFGKGCIVLAGIHPEAPDNWRRGMIFGTSAADDNAYALQLIRAALTGTTLAHY